MKKLYFSLIFLCCTFLTQAQVSKTVETTAGNLNNQLTTAELKTVTDLTITGTIDESDFNLMRDSMTMLQQLDITNVSVVSYSFMNEDDEIPLLAFANKSSLLNVQLPLTITSINENAFMGCRSLLSVTIPETVTYIGGSAFTDCTSLASITLPSSIKAIYASTFSGCNSLISVDIPSSVTSIGEWAFYDCRSMTSITIPSSVTSIGSYAFYACSSLTSLTIPSSITTIEEATFSSLVSITSLTIPNSVTSIGRKAFLGCQSLTSLTIPSSVNYMGELAFSRCTSLASVTLPSSITSISNSLFSYCEALSSINIPGSVTSIEASAFANCIHLANVEIPSSVTHIGNGSFSGCTSLKEITFPPTLIALDDGAFYGCTGLEILIIPSSVSHIGNGAFGECRGLKDIYAERSIPLELENPVFADTVKSTATLHVPYGSASLYATAFEWKDFTHIVQDSAGFKVSVQVLQLDTQGGESKATIISTVPWQATVDQDWVSLTRPSNVDTVLTVTVQANGTETNRSAVITITASNVASQQITVNQKSDPEIIAVTAGSLSYLLSKEEKDTITNLRLAGTINFWDIKTIDQQMPLLTDLDLSRTTIKATNGPEYYHQIVFFYPDNWMPGPTIARDDHIADRGLSKPLLRHLKLPASLEVIGSLAFAECTGLESVTIPTTVTSIGYAAFRGCASLDSITIPASVTMLSDYVFSGCSSLKKVNIEGHIKGIYTSTFRDCSSLASVTLPSTLQIIGSGAFSSCSALTTIALPESLNTLEQGAFENCAGFQSISSYNPLPPYADGAFPDVDKSTCIVYVPVGSGALYKETAGWKDFKNIVESLPEFSLSATTVSVKAGPKSTATISIVTDVAWSVSNEHPWLTISPESGSDDGTVTFTANENTNSFGRVDTITFSAENFLPRKVVVIQEGLPKTLNLTPGTLSATLTDEELKGVVNLTITGQMDARDFYTMRDKMPLLSILDLTKVTIVYDTLHGMYNRANSIPIYAFYQYFNGKGKSSLTSVLLPDSIREIDQVAFAYCTGLTTIKLTSAVNYIADGAFNNCINLHSIYSYPENPPFVDSDNVFKRVNKATCTLYVPYGSKELYEEAGYWKKFMNIVEMADLMLSATTATVEALQGSTATVELTGYGEWKAVADQSWLKISPQEGTGSQMLTFTADANTQDTVRIAIVTVSAIAMKDQTIVISQKGMVTEIAKADQNSSLMSIYPNPFTDQMSIEIANPLFKEVSVEIFSMTGQRIKTLAKAQKGAKINCTWDGRDEQGKEVTVGMYLLKVNEEVRKVVKE